MYKKIVVKVGTSVLKASSTGIDKDFISELARQISELVSDKIKVVLVSSGAIGAGAGLIGLKSLPNSLSELQAIASIGQNELMRIYSEAFGKEKRVIGQILLTQEDFNDRRRYLNIKYTIDALFEKGAIPVVNENDTVSTEEIKCGDNDRLSSLVADLTESDAHIILTDVDGVYDRAGETMRTVNEITEDIKALAGEKCSAFTKGGMATKIEAAERVTSAGIDCMIANGRTRNILKAVLSRKAACTYFKAKQVKKGAKKRWIAYSSKVKGSVFVDDGAKKALVSGNKSLLSSGIIKKEGSFKAGDAVSIRGSDGHEFARGLVNYSSGEVERIKGLKTKDIESALGYKDHDEVVHRDHLVVL